MKITAITKKTNKMKYQLGTYQTTGGHIKITKINTSESSLRPYFIKYLESNKFPTMFWVSEQFLAVIIQEKPTNPEPLENWKHPYYGQPILVRDRKDLEWEEEIFKCYVPNTTHPVITEESAYRFYKFPEQSIQMTTAELLALAKEVKGVDVELKEE